MVKVNIHLGAHKTATTSLQAVLRRNRGLLSKNNIFYFPREEFREEVSRLYFYPKAAEESCDINLLDVLAENGFYNGEEHVVISEENLIALVQEIFVDNEFYPHLLSRLKKLKKFFEGVEVGNIFFTVRDYSDFIPSIYTQINKSLKFFPFDGFRRRFSSHNFSWIAVLKDIAKVFPETKIVVARFEDMIRSPNEYYSKLIFEFPYDDLVDLDVRLNEGVSSEAVRSAEFVSSSLSVRLSGEQFTELSRLYPAAQYSKYMPFNEKDRKLLTKKYLHDLRIIEKEFGLFV